MCQVSPPDVNLQELSCVATFGFQCVGVALDLDHVVSACRYDGGGGARRRHAVVAGAGGVEAHHERRDDGDAYVRRACGRCAS